MVFKLLFFVRVSSKSRLHVERPNEDGIRLYNYFIAESKDKLSIFEINVLGRFDGNKIVVQSYVELPIAYPTILRQFSLYTDNKT